MVGGTKIVKKQPQEQQMQQAQPVMQQMPPQQMQQGQPGMQQMSPQQMQQLQQMQMQQMKQPIVPGVMLTKESLSGGSIDFNSKTFKYALLVMLLFIILNSKIIWKQLSRIPFMGQVEPSIIALIANSVLSAVIFYMIVQFVIK